MRIAYFTESLPPITDGVTRTLSRLATTLLAQEVDFRFVSPVPADRGLPWADRVIGVASVPFPAYDYYRLGLPYLQHAVQAALDRFRPDLVHVVSPTPLGVYGLRYAQRRRIPAVTSYHTRFVSYFPYYGLRGWEDLAWAYLRWFHNQFACTYAPSPSAERELRERGVREVEVWSRGIDVAGFSVDHRSSVLRAHLDADARPILLYTGRLVREKDLSDLVAACELLRGRGVAFRPVLVGDGPMRDELTARLPEAVFPGFRSGGELARWYASADIFVFPSTTETFGNVILEAFASGLPVVAAASGGALDLVQPGVNGVLARPNDPGHLADRIEFLLREPAYARWLGKHARENARAYDWTEVNGRLLDSYRILLATHHTSRAAATVPPSPSAEPASTSLT